MLGLSPACVENLFDVFLSLPFPLPPDERLDLVQELSPFGVNRLLLLEEVVYSVDHVACRFGQFLLLVIFDCFLAATSRVAEFELVLEVARLEVEELAVAVLVGNEEEDLIVEVK